MLRRTVIGVLAAAMLSGCSILQAPDVPLPGGADVGDTPFRVTANFENVLDLVPQSAVKVNDVPVGRVEEITLADDGQTAAVQLLVNDDVELPGNAVARLRQSSVLGEKFVELAEPEQGTPDGVLADGADIPVERTNRNPEFEEVLGALSLLLNGGGVGQLQQISHELNDALGGKEPAIRSLLRNVDTLVTGLDKHRKQIVRALEGLKTLSSSFGDRADEIGELVKHLGGGIKVLSQQRGQFVKMLKAMDSLSDVGVSTIRQSKADLIADLRALEPTLRQLHKAGQKLPQAMEMLMTMPFPDSALRGIKGDYLNVYLDLNTRTAGRGGGGTPQSSGAPPLPLPSADVGGTGGGR